MDKKIRRIVIQALKEDMPKGDVSSRYLFKKETTSARIIAKEAGVISGMEVMEAVFTLVDSSIRIKKEVKDGASVQKGDIIARIEGNTRSILMAERVALNFMQRLSGIATTTHDFVRMTQGTPAKILDTRKTTPNLRFLEKEAVLHGGGFNHRMSLSDRVMLKDNHIKAAGSIMESVYKVRRKLPTMIIEVEVETVPMFIEALESACDWIMLDNMSLESMAQCVALNQGKKILEASGNMTLERIRDVAQTGVDYISVGSLTHSYKSLDLSLKF
ncbi:MAG: carboxylating nicotinate-nucleotide diphosphorylase [Candidatus Izemoplasmatales bacterium]|nr:carboxylating nicotinate-nucleotide diphosphorylase [Candidatus Izemoplasmatales bacterium]